MDLFILYWILALALAGFFTSYQFGRTWPYTSEAGGQAFHINVFGAISAGVAFFFLVLILLVMLAREMEYIPDWLHLYQSFLNWFVWGNVAIATLCGLWAFFWRRNEKYNQFQEFIERATSHFDVAQNVPSTYHPYRSDFNFLNWGRPEYTSGRSSSTGSTRRATGNFFIFGSSSNRKKSSSKSSKKSSNKGDGASGIFQLLILLIIIIIAAATAAALVHFIAKWAIGIEEDWIHVEKGWASPVA